MRSFRFAVDEGGRMFKPEFGEGTPTWVSAYGAMHDVVYHVVLGYAFDADGEMGALGARLWRECSWLVGVSNGQALTQAVEAGYDTGRVLASAGDPFVSHPYTPPVYGLTPEERTIIGAATAASLPGGFAYLNHRAERAAAGYVAARQYWSYDRCVAGASLGRAFLAALHELDEYQSVACHHVDVSFDDVMPGCGLSFRVGIAAEAVC